jgi:hypothetical protein
MWWPHSTALSDLTVEETETGLNFSAPDDTECGAWLAYFSQTAELREEFGREITTILIKHHDEINGESKIPNRAERDRVRKEEDCSGAIPAY